MSTSRWSSSPSRSNVRVLTAAVAAALVSCAAHMDLDCKAHTLPLDKPTDKAKARNPPKGLPTNEPTLPGRCAHSVTDSGTGPGQSLTASLPAVGGAEAERRE
jgi:hypothetical protein